MISHPAHRAKLQVRHGLKEAPRQRRAEHRRRDGDGGDSGIERGGLIDNAAEIDQLRDLTGDLAGGLGRDDPRRSNLPPRKKVSISGPETPVISISPMQIEP